MLYLLAHFLLVLDLADAAAVAEVLGAGLAVAPGSILVVAEPISVSRMTLTREGSEEVDALGVHGAVVHLGLGTFVHVHNAGEGVQGTPSPAVWT